MIKQIKAALIALPEIAEQLRILNRCLGSTPQSRVEEVAKEFVKATTGWLPVSMIVRKEEPPNGSA